MYLTDVGMYNVVVAVAASRRTDVKGTRGYTVVQRILTQYGVGLISLPVVRNFYPNKSPKFYDVINYCHNATVCTWPPLVEFLYNFCSTCCFRIIHLCFLDCYTKALCNDEL